MRTKYSCCFLIRTIISRLKKVTLVDKENLLFIYRSLIIDVKVIVELENHHFVNFNETSKGRDTNTFW